MVTETIENKLADNPVWSRMAAVCGGVSGFVVLLLLVWTGVVWIQLPHAPPVRDPGSAPNNWLAPFVPATNTCRLFRRPQGVAPVGVGPLSKRFRLAGSFFAFGDGALSVSNALCKAILDDLQKKEQYLVAEGDRVEDVDVARIYRDHVLLRREGQEETLWLSFTSSDRAATNAMPSAVIRPALTMEDMPALESNRFGKRVGENRWIMKRDALVAYYQEMKDNPERMFALFASFKPEYNHGAITGYNLGIEGEKEFLAAMGLKEGDVVRKVNSMNMTSQNRAEYFIGEFVKNRASAFVFDVERNGQPQKMIYMVR